MKTLSIFKIVLFVATSTVLWSISDPVATEKTLFDWFSSLENVEMTVITDLDKLIRDKYKDEYQNAEVIIRGDNLEETTWPARVKARGVYRKRICDFPPIKINFGSELSESLGVREMGGLKLVTNCSAQLESHQLVQKEFLAYQMYQRVTDESFRVKLITIHWQDEKGNSPPSTQVNFMIESKEQLAERLKGTELEKYAVSADSLDMTSASRTGLFQYMIGNFDWSIENLRNVTLIQSNIDGKIKVIPYDFDFCALVDAPYVKVPRALNLTYQGERIFLGPYSSPTIAIAKKDLLDSKKEIYKCIRKCPTLNANHKSAVKRYIESFYQAIDEPLNIHKQRINED